MQVSWKNLARKSPAVSTAVPEQPPAESLYTVSPPAPCLAQPALGLLPWLGHDPAVTSLSLQFLICRLGTGSCTWWAVCECSDPRQACQCEVPRVPSTSGTMVEGQYGWGGKKTVPSSNQMTGPTR